MSDPEKTPAAAISETQPTAPAVSNLGGEQDAQQQMDNKPEYPTQAAPPPYPSQQYPIQQQQHSTNQYGQQPDYPPQYPVGDSQQHIGQQPPQYYQNNQSQQYMTQPPQQYLAGNPSSPYPTQGAPVPYYGGTLSQQPTVGMMINQFGSIPVDVHCSTCDTDIRTNIQYKTGAATWTATGIICIFGGWCGCCLIPLCIKTLKDVEHSCPNCNTVLGKWTRG